MGDTGGKGDGIHDRRIFGRIGLSEEPADDVDAACAAASRLVFGLPVIAAHRLGLHLEEEKRERVARGRLHEASCHYMVDYRVYITKDVTKTYGNLLPSKLLKALLD